MNKPKVTIITVCYNAVSAIEKTILSVINQTYDNKEYIIVDGGSQDGTVNIIKKHEGQIDKWISEPDNGIFDAMNKGLKMASGEWVNLMNAGDFFFSNSVLENVFSENIPMGIHFLYSDCEMRYPNGVKYIRKANVSSGIIFHQASIYRKALHDIYGYYCVKDTLVMSDALFINLIPAECFYHVPVVISSYDMGGTSVQNISCRIQLACFKYIFNKISIGELLKCVIRGYFLSLIPLKYANKLRKCKNILKRYLSGQK